MNTTSAPAVSAALRRAGFAPNSDRNREGIRVRQGRGVVYVTADFDSVRQSERYADDVEATLTRIGYPVARNGAQVTVTGQVVTARALEDADLQTALYNMDRDAALAARPAVQWTDAHRANEIEIEG